jgi:hypothetical protein
MQKIAGKVKSIKFKSSTNFTTVKVSCISRKPECFYIEGSPDLMEGDLLILEYLKVKGKRIVFKYSKVSLKNFMEVLYATNNDDR